MIVDTGVLYALLDRRDRHHRPAVELLTTTAATPRVPLLVVAEVAHLAATRLGTAAEVRFLADLATGTLITEPVSPADWERVAELVARYRDLPLGTVDASLVALAERLDDPVVASLDRRDLGVVRPRHCDALTLLP